MNRRKKARQIRILQRIRSPFPVRRDDWKLTIEIVESVGKKFIYQTKDDRDGQLVFLIKRDWTCELIESSGYFSQRTERVRRVREIINELNREFRGIGKSGKNGIEKNS